LLAVASIGEEAYAIIIKSFTEAKADRKVNISAIHSALYRLEEKGCLRSSFGGATLKRGGKNKRYFHVTATGFAILKQAKRIREDLWSTIPQLSAKSV
jgi:PadR family transcriptional regulator PadR